MTARLEIYEDNVRCQGGITYVDLVVMPLNKEDTIEIGYSCDCTHNCECPELFSFCDKNSNMGFSEPSEIIRGCRDHNGLRIFNVTEEDLDSLLELLRDTISDYENSINSIDRRLRRRWLI